MKTALCERLGIDIPIIQAPMGGAVGPEIAAAVSNAGALGSLAPWFLDEAPLRKELRDTRALTTRPFMVNLNLAFPQEERLAIVLDEGASIISFFWNFEPALIARAKVAGATVLQTVATSADARRAADAGADIVVAQGWEAGGHVRGDISTLALVPVVVDAAGGLPVVAAGGIADGRGMAAALALGAAGAWIGTRFLLSPEATVHPYYQERLRNADEASTVHLDNLFDGGWPDAPHRVLRNSTVEQWERAGRPPTGNRPGEGEVVARSAMEEIQRYACGMPKPEMQGDMEALSMWAGQGVGLARKVMPAAEIVLEINAEAEAVLHRLGR
jgi:nitronate monooxygenase